MIAALSVLLAGGLTTAHEQAALSAYLEGALDAAGVPAAAVAVVERDRVVYLAGFGRDARGGMAVTPESRFYLGSCTKTLTAFAVLQLAERGRLDLEAPLRSYLPDFSMGHPAAAAALEVRHLLGHASGIGTRTAFDREAQRDGRFDHLDFDAWPGERVDYSSLNYLLLGRLIERASGLPYAEYMRRNVFGPLGMDDTTASREAADAISTVQGHSYFFGFRVAREEPPYPPLMVPAGYVVSSARDLAGFLSFLVDPDRQASAGILSPRAVERMLAPWDGRATGATLGWGVARWRGEPRVGHAGMTPGFAARLALLPQRGVGVAVLMARNSGPFLPADADLVEGVLEHVAGSPGQAPRPREHWVRLAMLLLALWTFVSLGREARRYRSAGLPWRSPRVGRPWLTAAAKIVLQVGFAVWILRFLAEISLAGLLEFYPDLGLLLVVGTAFGTLEAVLQAQRADARAARAAAGASAAN